MRLLGRTGPLAGRTVAVAGPIRIGRAPENELQLSIDGISRTHARVTPEGDAFFVEDLNSANGTFLNGVRVTKERLAHLDVITIGRIADLIVDARAVAAPAVSPVTGDAFLEVVDGPEEGTKIPIPPGEITIGRVAPSGILVDSRVVSKLHARLRRTSDRLALDDLDSPNGTFVNGAKITTNRTLNDGDTVSVAGVRSFRVRLSGSSTPPPVPAAAVAPTVVAPPDQPPAFNQEWKTKLVWSADELASVEAERARVIEEVKKSTGGLPGQDSGPSAAPAAPKTQFVGRAPVEAPPSFSPAAAEAPAARKTEFLGRDQIPMPPPLETSAPPPAPPPPPRAAAPPPPAPAPVRPTPPQGDLPATSAFRPAADLPPVFAEAAPIAPEPPPPPPPAPPAPPLAARHAGPEAPTSAFRPAADLPPNFADLPVTGVVTVPVVPKFALKGPAGEFALAEGSQIVGRQEGVPVFIPDRQVSRHHAVITVQQGRVTIEDKASANGTFVNGARLTAPRDLSAGDQVKFGDLLFTIVTKN